MAITPESLASSTTITSAVSTLAVSSYDLSDVGIIVGIVFTVASFAVSIVFHVRKETLESMHFRRMWNASNQRKMQKACESTETATTNSRETRKR